MSENCAECDRTSGRCAKCKDGFELSSGCAQPEQNKLWIYLTAAGGGLAVVLAASIVVFYCRYQKHQEAKAKAQEEEQKLQQENQAQVNRLLSQIDEKAPLLPSEKHAQQSSTRQHD